MGLPLRPRKIVYFASFSHFRIQKTFFGLSVSMHALDLIEICMMNDCDIEMMYAVVDILKNVKFAQFELLLSILSLVKMCLKLYIRNCLVTFSSYSA